MNGSFIGEEQISGLKQKNRQDIPLNNSLLYLPRLSLTYLRILSTNKDDIYYPYERITYLDTDRN